MVLCFIFSMNKIIDWMDKRIRKKKKEGDCRDCWIKRFQKELLERYKTNSISITVSDSVSGPSDGTLNEFLAREHWERKNAVDYLRAEATDVYDEIAAIEALASQLYMTPESVASITEDPEKS